MQPRPTTSLDVDAAITEIWQEQAGGRIPHQAWYWTPGFQPEEATDDFLALLRGVHWKDRERVRINNEVKLERTSGDVGETLVRVSMPDQFVPSFVFGERTFVLVSAMVSGQSVEFSEVGTSRTPRRPTRSEPTRFVPGGGMDLPVPAAILRGARVRADARPLATHVVASRPLPNPTTLPAAAVPVPFSSSDPTDVPPSAPRSAERAGRAAPVVRERAALPPPPAADERPTPPSPPRAAGERSVLDDDMPAERPMSFTHVLLVVAGVLALLVAVLIFASSH